MSEITGQYKPNMTIDVSNPENLYRILFEDAADGMFIADPQGKYVVINSIGMQMTGYSAEECQNLALKDLFSTDDLARNLFSMYDLRPGNMVTIERFIRRKDGSLFLAEIKTRMLSEGNLLGIVRDITESKRAETALSESELFLKETQRIARLAGWKANLQTDYLAWTDGVYDIIEAPRNYRPGLSEGLRYFCPEYIPIISERLSLCFATGKPFVVEAEVITDTGKCLWTEVRGLVPVVGGEQSYVIGTFQDITERKHAEDAIRESEERYRALFDRSLDCVFLCDFEGNFIDANQAVLDLLGYHREDIPTLTFATLLTEDQLPLAFQRTEEVRVKGFQTNLAEYNVLCKDGRQVSMEVHSSLIYRSGKPFAMQGIARDVTERKRIAEDRERALAMLETSLAQSPSGILIADAPDVTIRWANTAALGIRGETKLPLTEIDVSHHSANWQTFQSDGTPYPPEKLPLSRAVLEGKITRNEEVIIRNAQGEDRWVSVNAAPVRNRDGVIVSGIVIFHDITELKKTDEERVKLQAQLTQAQKMESVGRLAGGVAHDFNNMLSVILGRTEIMLMGMDYRDPYYKNLEEIRKAAQRSADLTRQLLAFARKQTVAPKVLDVNDTIAGMLKMLRRLIGEDIDLVWIPGAGLWSVKIDPSQIDQLLANLCINARDAIIGVGRVTIETKNTTLDETYCASHPGSVRGEYVMLAVSDNGCGMGKEVLDHLFEPFFTTKGLGKGTGLGLATVYGTVKQNDGFINVSSEPGKGTIFNIYLPRVVGDAEETMKEVKVEAPKGHGETVLLVEDEAMILNVGKSMLQELGYTVLGASSPSEAIDQAQSGAGQIQLLITDVVMPEMNGRDLAKLINDIKPDMKCLFISGYTADVIAHSGVLEEGVNFISKPFSILNLATKVREVLDS